MLSSASEVAELLAEQFGKSSMLYDKDSSLPDYQKRTNASYSEFTVTLRLVAQAISQLELGDDVNVHAYLNNSDKYKDIKTVIRMLGPDICRALPFFTHFQEVISCQVFSGRVNAKCCTFGYKVFTRMSSLLFSSNLEILLRK